MDSLRIQPDHIGQDTLQFKMENLPVINGVFMHEGTQVHLIDAPQVTQVLEIQPRVYALLDADQNLIGGCTLSRSATPSVELKPTPLLQALQDTYPLFVSPTESELANLITDLPTLFSSESEFVELTGIQSITQFPFSIMFHYHRLYRRDLEMTQMRPPYPRAIAHLNLLIETFGTKASALGFCISDEHASKRATDMALRYPDQAAELIPAYFAIFEILESFELVLQKLNPQEYSQKQKEQHSQTIDLFKKQIFDIATQITKTALTQHSNPNFSWELIEAAFGSLQQVFDDIFQVTVDIPSKRTLSEQHIILTNLFSDTEHSSDLLAIGQSMIETQFFRSLSRAIPNEFQNACEFFYPSSGDELEKSIASATGDTQQELTRYATIIEWLKDQHLIPESFSLLDAGVGHGRILEPIMDAYRPQLKRVVGLDINPQTTNTPWEKAQADLGQQHNTVLGGGEPYNMALSTWSVLQDLPYHEQEIMLANISNSLQPGGILVIDIASFENYRAEADEYHAAHPEEPYGTMERHFELSDGTKLTKKFAIDPDYISLTLFKKAGFQLVSEPLNSNTPTIPNTPSKWKTKSDHIRHTFVLQKVSEPEPSLTAWHQTQV